MENRLYRSESDKKIAGVCGGIAEYFGIDSTIVRLLWLISIAVYGTGFLIYIIAAIIMPGREDINAGTDPNKNSNKINSPKDSTFNRGFDREKNRKFFGYALIVVGIILFGKRFTILRWLSFKFLFPIVLIVLGIFILSNNSKKRF
ncbi:MAG TPA: PspC domain-containing protein [Clostridia bacterium]|nr:PspC domain-containing protein [Clostridia bacterium]